MEICRSALNILCFLFEDNFDEESMTHNDTGACLFLSVSITVHLYFLSVCLPLVFVFPTRTMLLHQELTKNNLKLITFKMKC